MTAVTTTSITSSPATPVVGQPVTYTATVAVVPPGSGTPTGAVTFTGNSGPLCTSPLNQSSPDTASCTTTYTSLLPAASDTVSAAYAGDGNFLYSTSPLLTVPITQAANTTSLTVDDANPVVGQSVTFTATVAVSAPGAATPTGMVTFTGGAGILCEPTLSSTSPFTATCRTSYPAAGSDSVFAVYSGDLNDQVGISNSVAMSISASTTTALATTDSTPVVGQTVTFTATVAPSAPGAATPTGMVTFASGSGTLCTSTLSSTSPYTATCTTSFASVGNTAVTATYNGGPNFTGSASSPLGERISAAQTTSTLSANVSSSVTNQQITFTADVDTVAPGGGTPSGVVTFTQKSGSTTTTICTSTLSSRTPDTATCTTSYANVGNRTVTATYAGTANYVGSVSNALIMSVAPARTTTLLSASPVPSVTGQGLTLTATVVAVAPSTGTPTGKVDFVVESAGNQAIACTGGNSKTLSGGTATCVIAGSKLTASDSPLGVLAGYEGTSAYQPSSTSTNERHQPSGNDDDGGLPALPFDTGASGEFHGFGRRRLPRQRHSGRQREFQVLLSQPARVHRGRHGQPDAIGQCDLQDREGFDHLVGDGHRHLSRIKRLPAVDGVSESVSELDAWFRPEPHSTGPGTKSLGAASAVCPICQPLRAIASEKGNAQRWG